jgi:hypothetical protein
MDQTQQTPTPAAAGPVTLDDVRQALGETDPHATNAGKLRVILGRGGMGTIQKHLDAIRAERAAALMPQESALMPAAPGEAIAAIWAAAYGIAEARVRRRLDAVTAERDGLDLLASTLRADLAEMAAVADLASTAADQADGAARASASAAASLRAQLAEAQEALQKAREQHVAEMAQAQAQAASEARLAALEHAQALQRVEHDRQTERLALQTAIDSASQRHAEALGLLHALRPAAPAAEAKGTGARKGSGPQDSLIE